MIYETTKTDKPFENQVILTREMLHRLKDELQWPDQAERDIERAIEQAGQRLEEKETHS